MSIQTAQYSLTTTPTPIYAGDGACTIHIHSAAGKCYIGNSAVTSSTGFLIDNGTTAEIAGHETPLYAATDTSASISVMILSK